MAQAQVRFQNTLTDLFVTQKGLKEGDGLTVEKLNINFKKKLPFKSHQIVAHADDISISSRPFLDVKETLAGLDMAANEITLKVNANKTKVMM